MTESISRLSSGVRIDSAADNAAGMAVSENMRAQLKGFQQAMRRLPAACAVNSTRAGAPTLISAPDASACAGAIFAYSAICPRARIFARGPAMQASNPTNECGVEKKKFTTSTLARELEFRRRRLCPRRPSFAYVLSFFPIRSYRPVIPPARAPRPRRAPARRAAAASRPRTPVAAAAGRARSGRG